MPKSKYYNLLGLSPTASDKEVKKQYRTLAMKYHPDRNPDPNAHELFILLTEAYSVILNKETPVYSKPTSKGTSSTEQKEKEHEERMRTARKRYAEQALRQKEENQNYYRQLTAGYKWKTLKIIAFTGVLLSFMLVFDLFLPHHFKKDEVTHYKLNIARGPSGQQLSIVKTANGDHYWISRMTYSLYAKTRSVYIESSWIFHNPIRIISRDKIRPKYFDIHFTFYNATGLLIFFFLIPIFTIWYKRMKIGFTFLFYTSYYGVSLLLLIFLITGNRWAHIITLGYF